MGATAETWAMYRAEVETPLQRVLLFALSGLGPDPTEVGELHGSHFTLEKLTSYSNCPEREVRDALNWLTDRQFIRDVVPQPDGSFTCTLAVVRDRQYIW